MSTRRKKQHLKRRAEPPSLRATRPMFTGRTSGASPGLFGSPGELESECPVCGAEVTEVGGMGCCTAITANCAGSLDGEPVPPEGLDDDDPRAALIVTHFWYTDTGKRAPHEWEDDGIVCRCS